MTQEHPITPPEELVDQWNEAWIDAKVKHEGLVTFIATQAAQWGADQELEACCHCFARDLRESLALELRARRRPKPLSLKEQALEELEQLRGDANSMGMGFDAPAIRRALEQLDD
jgi:hypothetical protein